jgi:hypothetical protein
VQARQRVQLTGTNRPIGFDPIQKKTDRESIRPDKSTSMVQIPDRKDIAATAAVSCACVLQVWWQQRERNTRSHPELGR